MPTIGKRIERLRAGLDLSREELAEKINVSRQTLYRWENDRTLPKTDQLKRLCEVLAVDPEYIIHGIQSVSEEEPLAENTAAEPSLTENVTEESAVSEFAERKIAEESEIPKHSARLKTALKLLAIIAISAVAVFTVFVLVSVGIIYLQPHSGIDEVTATEYHNYEGAAVLIAGIILAVAGVASLVFWLISRKKSGCNKNVTKKGGL